METEGARRGRLSALIPRTPESGTSPILVLGVGLSSDRKTEEGHTTRERLRRVSTSQTLTISVPLSRSSRGNIIMKKMAGMLVSPSSSLPPGSVQENATAGRDRRVQRPREAVLRRALQPVPR